jgi:hypothetical protein
LFSCSAVLTGGSQAGAPCLQWWWHHDCLRAQPPDHMGLDFALSHTHLRTLWLWASYWPFCTQFLHRYHRDNDSTHFRVEERVKSTFIHKLLRKVSGMVWAEVGFSINIYLSDLFGATFMTLSASLWGNILLPPSKMQNQSLRFSLKELTTTSQLGMAFKKPRRT